MSCKLLLFLFFDKIASKLLLIKKIDDEFELLTKIIKLN